MKKMEDHSKQVLNLYEVHEVEQQEKNKKIKTVPIVLIIIAIILIVGGVIYPYALKFISNYKKNKNKEEVVEVDENRLKCNYKEDDTSLGVNYTYHHNYTFEQKKLKESEYTIVISALPNSDIAVDNITTMNKKYTEYMNKINQLTGIDAKATLTNNQLTLTYHINYKEADLTKIPKDTLIVTNNILDEDYKSVKKKNQQSSYLC